MSLLPVAFFAGKEPGKGANRRFFAAGIFQKHPGVHPRASGLDHAGLIPGKKVRQLPVLRISRVTVCFFQQIFQLCRTLFGSFPDDGQIVRVKKEPGMILPDLAYPGTVLQKSSFSGIGSKYKKTDQAAKPYRKDHLIHKILHKNLKEYTLYHFFYKDFY